MKSLAVEEADGNPLTGSRDFFFRPDTNTQPNRKTNKQTNEHTRARLCKGLCRTKDFGPTDCRTKDFDPTDIPGRKIHMYPSKRK